MRPVGPQAPDWESYHGEEPALGNAEEGGQTGSQNMMMRGAALNVEQIVCRDVYGEWRQGQSNQVAEELATWISVVEAELAD